MKILLALTAVVLLAVSACGGGHSPAARTTTPPATATTASAPASASPADRANEDLACFAWTTYDKATQSGEIDTKDAAFAAQFAGKVSDPRWSAIAAMPAEQAMSTLGGLCQEIGYHE